MAKQEEPVPESRITLTEFLYGQNISPEVRAGFSVFVGKDWMTPSEWKEKYQEYVKR